MHLSFRLLSVFLVLFVGLLSKAQRSSVLNVKDFDNAIQHSQVQLLDVRTPKEFAEGHIKNALNYNINDPKFASAVSLLNKSNPVYVYCLSGGRSHKAATYLQTNGFKNVYELDGGLTKWRTAGLPEEGKYETSAGNLTLQDYELRIKNDSLLLVDFCADWSTPCTIIHPFVEDVIKEGKGAVHLWHINVDENVDLTQSLKINAVPTLMLYKAGQLQWRNVGLTDKKHIQNAVKKEL